MHLIRWATAIVILLLTAAATEIAGQPNTSSESGASEAFNRGLALFENGRDDAALAQFRQAVQIDPPPG